MNTFCERQIYEFMSKNYNPKPLNGIPGPLGVINSGRMGACNKDSRILTAD